MRQMTLVAFLQAQNCSNFVGSWRHPDALPDFTSAEYYRRIARVLEAGKFHLGFFDDRLAMPDRFGGDHAHTVANGIRCVKMDPVTILTVMGMATERLGLGATYSTTYYEPFHVARVFATLDLMTGGRAAWNVVTSINDGEALNMGLAQHMGHDERYDRADEFLEVVLGHWDTWEDDALVVDKASGLFAHPDKVHRLDHAGKFFRSRGPFTVPRSAQGHPVLIQAGQSGRGQRFAARWAELIFVAYHEIDRARDDYAAFKSMVAATGRDPAQVHVAMAVYPVVAETRTEAEDKTRPDRTPAARHRSAVAAVGSAELRFRRQGLGRGVQRRRTRRHHRAAGHARPGGAAQRQEESHRARLHGRLRTRHDPRPSGALRQRGATSPTRWRLGSPPRRATGS